MNEILLKPSECSKDEINQFYNMIKRNENLKTIGLKRRIKKSKILVFNYNNNNELRGIGALKIPSKNYINKIFNLAGISHLNKDYHLEIGYLYVDRKYRQKGISKSITENIVLFSQDNNIFAVVRTDNKPAKKNLFNYGFRKSGINYKGRENLYFEIYTLNNKERNYNENINC